MSERERRLTERVLDPDFASQPQQRPLQELRRLRDDAREAENELSFERRLCQARIDILVAELEARGGRSRHPVIERLPEILAPEGGRREEGLPERAPVLTTPRNADIPRRRVEELVGEETLARLGELGSDEVEAALAALRAHEQEVSQRRRRVQEILDALQEEIARRYAEGEADPGSLLA